MKEATSLNRVARPPRCPSYSLAIVALTAAASLWNSTAVAETYYRVVADLPQGNGYGPATGLTLSTDGTTFYGALEGPFQVGRLFSIGVDGSNFHTFAKPGPILLNGLTLNGSTLYGTTFTHEVTANLYSAPTNPLNPGASNTTVIHRFNSTEYAMQVTLVGSTLYGTTWSDQNQLYSVGTDGSAFQVLHTFSGPPPLSGFLQVGSTLYGTTTPYMDPFSGGQLYSYDTATSTYTTLATLPPSIPPIGSLTRIGNTLYGMYAQTGGTGGQGGVYSINLDGSNFQILHSFGIDGTAYTIERFVPPFDGFEIPGGLTAFGNVLYGTVAVTGDVNGAETGGEVFRINSDGSDFQVVHSFTGPLDGSLPFGDLTLVGDTLYGTTRDGGANNAGTIYAITVPEPSSWLLAALAAAALGLMGRRRSRRRASAAM